MKQWYEVRYIQCKYGTNQEVSKRKATYDKAVSFMKDVSAKIVDLDNDWVLYDIWLDDYPTKIIGIFKLTEEKVD